MRTFLATMICLFICSGASQGQTLSPKLQAVMQAAAPAEKIAVIIELADQTDLRSFTVPGRPVRQMGPGERQAHRAGLIRALKNRAERTQGGLRDFLRDQGIVRQKNLWISNSIATEVSSEVLQQLAERPEVASIRIDALISLPRVVPAATGGVEDNIILIKAPDLWALGYHGEGTVVALLDSGVDYLHPDLNASWRGGSNSWFNPVASGCTGICTSCDLSETVPCDYTDSFDVAHGTGVAGIMVGGNAGGTAIGVAPQAQWIAAKIFKSDDTALFSDIHLAFQWVLDPDGDSGTDDAPDVVNNSWGLDPAGTYFGEFRSDVQALEAAGIAAVFSAGNFGPTAKTDISPANYPESIAVGSVGTAGSDVLISDFSGRGPSSFDGATFPDIVAPGYFIYTTGYTSGGASPNSYTFLPGTSFSAPHVSGIIALLIQAFPQTPLADIEDAITLSAQDLGALGPDNDYGHGLIDATAAYDWLIQAPNLAVTDPIPPTNDRQLDFGTILPSTVSQKTIVCSNSGRGELQIGTVLLTGDTEFSLVADDCSHRALTTENPSCNLVVAFSSATTGTFAGSINLPSNDFDEPSTAIVLGGVVSDTATPSPNLVITDSVAPTGDKNIPFGTLLVGNSRTENFQVANSNPGNLILGVLDSSALDAAFTVVTDACSNRTLADSESCRVEISFTPTAAGSFNGTLSLPSNDPDTPTSQITLSGAGNNLPPTPALISPPPGASKVSVPVVVTWRQLPDPDGNPVTNRLYVSEDPNFNATTPIQISAQLAEQDALPAGIGGLLLAGLLFLRRKKSSLLWVLALTAVVVLTSCGGGGGGGGGTAAGSDPNLRSHILKNLSPHTTYYWKVSADDGKGGTAESSVASFTTQ